MKHKLFRNLSAAGLIAAGILLICGCSSKEPLANAYTFPENGIRELVSSSSNLNYPGFADSLCVPERNADKNTDDVDAKAFGLFGLSEKEVLSQHNIYDKMYPASTTKILTCLIALERGDLDAVVTVPEESDIDVSGSSMADLQPGDTLTLRELLYAMMVPSGNDAAVAIACHISGDVDTFAQLMNLTAKRIGATQSNFINPHGLPDENHYTTVYDMYLIFNEALKNPEFRKIAGTKEYTCKVNTAEGSANAPREITWTTSNAFLNEKFSFAEGMDIIAGKTGHTSAAGFCLVLGEAAQNGNEYISIIMNAPIYENMYASMAKLAGKSAGTAASE